MSNSDASGDWQCHGWDDHIRGQLEHGRGMTFRQKLEWLEEMSQLVAYLKRSNETPARVVREDAPDTTERP
ncbi:MAG: hypothetical protein ACREIA_09925 [Opitutaceae bacterium]